MNKTIEFVTSVDDMDNEILQVLVDAHPKYDIYVYNLGGKLLKERQENKMVCAFFTDEEKKNRGASYKGYLEACAYVLAQEEIEFLLETDEEYTLRWTFDELTHEYYWVFHDSHGHGFFLVKNWLSHTGLTEDMVTLRERLADKEYKDCEYLLQHSNAVFNVKHYAIWDTFYPFFNMMIPIRCWPGESFEYKATFSEWQECMRILNTVGGVLLSDAESVGQILTMSSQRSVVTEIPLHL